MPKHHHHHHHHWHDDKKNRWGGTDKTGYAHQAGQPGPGPNPHRLYRSTDDKMIAGVCGGLAEYFGWEPTWIRLVVGGSIFFFGPMTVISYVAAAILIKKRPLGPARPTTEDERFWRTVTTRPRMGFSELKHKFRALDKRIADMEHAVISEEYGLRRAFRDLERGAH